MEGRVVQKVDCRPVVSKNYMQLKKAQMIEACRPKRITKQLSSVVKTYKPVNITKEEVCHLVQTIYYHILTSFAFAKKVYIEN